MRDLHSSKQVISEKKLDLCELKLGPLIRKIQEFEREKERDRERKRVREGRERE